MPKLISQKHPDNTNYRYKICIICCCGIIFYDFVIVAHCKTAVVMMMRRNHDNIEAACMLLDLTQDYEDEEDDETWPDYK